MTERLDAPHDHQQIVLTRQREDSVYKIVSGALVAQVDLQPIGKEREQVGGQIVVLVGLDEAGQLDTLVSLDLGGERFELDAVSTSSAESSAISACNGPRIAIASASASSFRIAAK